MSKNNVITDRKPRSVRRGGPDREGGTAVIRRRPLALQPRRASNPPSITTIVNKSMQRSDLDQPACRRVVDQLFELMRTLQKRGVPYSSWYGQTDAWPSVWEHINRGEGYRPFPGNPDELRIPWFLLWEIAWLTANTPIQPRSRILDMGGAGSLFSCYLASLGHEVHAIDLNPDLCKLARAQADAMKWNLHPKVMDMTRLQFPPDYFDHVFSVCVFEHLPVSGRVACNGEVDRILRPGGTTGFTFDYANPQAFGRIDTPADVTRQFVEASGLEVRGNSVFHDAGERDLETPCTFGFGRFVRWMARLHAACTGSVAGGRAIRGDTRYTFGALLMRKPDNRAGSIRMGRMTEGKRVAEKSQIGGE